MTIDPAAAAQPDGQQALLDSLLYSVSHDLRSPLLTMTLAAELVEAELQAADFASGGAAFAIDSLKQGAADMERMLQALMLLSRARQRAVEPGRGALSLILGGYAVTPSDLDLRSIVVRVDPLLVRELLDGVAVHEGGVVGVQVARDAVTLEITVPAIEHGPTPLHALAASLKQYAGTPVETVAVAQILLERCGAMVRCSDGRATVRLPREAATP